MSFSSEPELPERPLRTSQIAGRLGLANVSFGIAALAALSVWLIVNWWNAIRAMIHTYNPLPTWDYWRVVQYFDRYRALDFSVLWIQHNEHRIVFPETIFALDMLLFHGRQLLPLTVSFVCYFLVWLVLSLAFSSDKSLSPLVRWAGILLSGVVVGWQGCVVVVGSAFLLQWTMLQLAVTLGMFLLVQARHPGSYLCLAGAITCGVIATYSSGNGMLIWPVMILGALLIPLTRFRFWIVILAAVVSTTLYFFGYHSSHDLNLLAMVQHPIYVVGFIASYLSMPFGVIGNATVSLMVGGINLLLFLVVVVVVIRRRLFRNDLPIMLLGGYLFSLLTAALTAAGRMNPADHQFIAAKAARYVSLPLVNWAVLLLAIIWLSSKRKWEVFSAGNIIFVAALVFLAALPKLDTWLQGNYAATADQQWAALSLESGLFTPSVLRGQIFPDPGFVEHFLPTLQKNHLSIYWNQPDVTWVGHPAKSEFPGVWTESLRGDVSEIYPVAGGAEISGSASHIQRGGQLIFVDEHGEIVGLGERVPAGVPDILTGTSSANQQKWVGFLNSSYGSKEFSVYLVQGEGVAQITNPVSLPGLKEAAASDVGATIPGLTWEASQWKPGALFTGIDVGTNYRGPFWSSWNGSDASTGQITSSVIPVPANHCLILPILHGPSVQGLSAEITNAETNQTVEKIPMQNGETQWKLWRFPIDPKISSIRILGRDVGAAWGQWLAIGDPQQCR